MNDLVSGQVDVLCDQSTTAVPQIQGDKIRAYAVDLDRAARRAAEHADGEGGRHRSRNDDLARPLRAEGHAGSAVSTSSTARSKAALKDPMVLDRFKAVGTSAFPHAEWTPRRPYASASATR